MSQHGWLTPDTIPAEKICRTLSIPAEFEYIVPAVMGALYPLTLEYNWEQHGSITPAQMAAAMLQMYLSIQGDSCGGAMPDIGEGKLWFGADGTIPTGWLKCDGSIISRTTYAALFAVIGETYGSGDGTTTFELPDGRGATMIGAGQAFSGGTTWPAGTRSGSERVTLSDAEMPAHTHSIANPAYGVDAGGAHLPYTPGAFSLLGLPTVTGSAGSGQSHNNMQPSQVVGSWLIYAGV